MNGPGAARRPVRRVAHLAERFVRALWPAPPHAGDQAWADAQLRPGERDLFAAMANHDRRHAIGVAHRVADALGADAEPRWLAAALLHDVGKQHAHLGVIGRSLATVTMAAAGTARVQHWHTDGVGGWRGRVATYAHHGELGAADLRACGGHEEAAVWAAAHHHPDTWATLEIPAPVITALDAADND